MRVLDETVNAQFTSRATVLTILIVYNYHIVIIVRELLLLYVLSCYRNYFRNMRSIVKADSNDMLQLRG